MLISKVAALPDQDNVSQMVRRVRKLFRWFLKCWTNIYAIMVAGPPRIGEGTGFDSQGSVTFFYKYCFPNLYWIHWVILGKWFGHQLQHQVHVEEEYLYVLVSMNYIHSILCQIHISTTSIGVPIFKSAANLSAAPAQVGKSFLKEKVSYDGL